MITDVLLDVEPEDDSLVSIFKNTYCVFSDEKSLTVKVKVDSPDFFGNLKYLQSHHTITLVLTFKDEDSSKPLRMTLTPLEFNFTNIIIHKKINTPMYVDLKFLIRGIKID